MDEPVLFACCVVLLLSQVPTDGKSIDKIIMDAAANVDMFDLIHLDPSSKAMAMVELDILLNMTELGQYKAPNRYRRKGLRDVRSLWPDNRVMYEINRGDFDIGNVNVIRGGIAEWEKFTCLEFTENANSKDRIMFRNGGGCYSRLGRSGGVQPIALAPGCRTQGIVVHEIGHAIGWIHEQARPDRDNYIQVNFAQIPSNWRSQFAKVSSSLVDSRGVEYDYDSVMHYSGTAFGPGTIRTKNPADQNRIGQRKGLSFRDIKLANIMYSCSRSCTPFECEGEGFRGKDCMCYCPGNPVTLCELQPDKNMSTTTPPMNMTTPLMTMTTPPMPTDTATTPEPTAQCMDLRDDCSMLKENNRCLTDTARMSIFCRLTCNLCIIDPSQNCMDYDEACPLFASNGFCNETIIGSVAQFFREECPLSCEQCTPPDACAGRDFSSGHQLSPSLAILLLFVATHVISRLV